jgi:hypothetical protein
MTRSRVAMALVALLGVAAAVGVGLAVNEVSGDSIGLSAEPLKAGERLAPSEARDGRTREGRRTRHRRRRGRDSDVPSEGVPGVTLTEPGAEDDRATGGGIELGDHRGRGRGGDDRSGSGSGSSGSGSGSSGSGSGSSGDDSGSSGGGSNSGPGSDD